MKRHYNQVIEEIKAFLQDKVNVEVDILRRVDPITFYTKNVLMLDKKEAGISISNDIVTDIVFERCEYITVQEITAALLYEINRQHPEVLKEKNENHT
jgi:hypothetical protein